MKGKIIAVIIVLLMIIWFINISNVHHAPGFAYSLDIHGNSSDLVLYIPVPMDTNGNIPLEEGFEYVDTIHGKMVKLNVSEDKYAVEYLTEYGNYDWYLDRGWFDKNPDLLDPINNSFILYPAENIHYQGIKAIYSVGGKGKCWKYDSWIYREAKDDFRIRLEWFGDAEVGFWDAVFADKFGIGYWGVYRIEGETDIPAGEGWVKVEMKIISDIYPKSRLTE